MKINRDGDFKTLDKKALELVKDINLSKYVIPPFQRAYVWKEKDVETLVDSIIHLFPIGQILVWDDREENILNIIDGQQRVTSLYLIMSNPFKYLTEELFLEINSDVNGITSRSLKNILFEIKKINFSQEETNSINVFSDLISNNDNKINEYYNLRVDQIFDQERTNHDDPNFFSIRNKIKNNIFKRYLNILANLNIPETKLSNFEEEQVIEIFNRLNQKGIKLTEFEIFSAIWSRNKIDIKNKKILKPIEEQRTKNNRYFSQYNKELENNFIRKNKEYIPSELYFSLMYYSFENTTFFKEKYLKMIKDKDNNIGSEMFLESRLEIFLPFVYNFLVLKKYINSQDGKQTYEKIGVALKNWYEDNEENIEIEIEKYFKKPWKIMENNILKLTTKINKNDFLFEKLFKSENIYVSTATQILKTIFEIPNQSFDNVNNNVWYYALNNDFASSTSQIMKNNIRDLKYLISSKNTDDFEKMINDYSNELNNFNNNSNFPSSTKKTILEAIINTSLFSFDQSKKYKTSKLFHKSIFENLNINNYYHSIGNHGFGKENNGKVIINNTSQILDKLCKDDILTINLIENKSRYSEYSEMLKNNNLFQNKELFIEFLNLREKIMTKIFLKEVLK